MWSSRVTLFYQVAKSRQKPLLVVLIFMITNVCNLTKTFPAYLRDTEVNSSMKTKPLCRHRVSTVLPSIAVKCLVTYLLVHSALMSHLARVKVMWISTGPFRASSSRAPSMCLEDELALPLYLHHCPRVEFYKHLQSSLGNAHQDQARSDIWLHLPVVLKFDPSSPASPTVQVIMRFRTLKCNSKSHCMYQRWSIPAAWPCFDQEFDRKVLPQSTHS